MKRNITGERFTVALIAGRWEELYHRDTKRGYLQRCNATATIDVRTVRRSARNRDGKKIETVQQYLTGEPVAIESYLSTFPQVQSLRVSSMIDRTGVMVQTQF